ncbi:integrase catalytic subunit [mine drainage metagenome]|uniref:Integrase catalytic subunit n=2 Tax=mine drainage metagenome TaxID=410659 RepID=T1BFQ5_9ZZZZ
MRKIRDVLRLVDAGLSLRQVAASLGIAFSTAGNYVKRAEHAGISWPLPEDLDDDALKAMLFPSPSSPGAKARPAPDWEKIHRELRRKGVTLMLLWFEYREDHPDGYAYSQFCEHYRRWRLHLDVVMRQSHRAGEKLFVDFPGMKIPIYNDHTGQLDFEAELFVAVLGASSYIYAEVLRSQELPYFVTAHVNTFEHLGGCPEIVVCDNLRSGVTQPNRYEPDVNATYQEMASHYGVAIIPTRSYKPRDKAKVESGVLLAERWLIARLRHERFTSLAEANLAIGKLLTWLNARPFKKLEGSRQSLFEQIDYPALRSLPTERYEFATWRRARIGLDYHIEVRSDHHCYSVPYRLVGEVVDLRVSMATIEVFYRHARVASHVRSYTSGYTTDPAHMPESHRRHLEWTPTRIISWANAAGPATGKLVEEILVVRPHPEQGYRASLGIVRLGMRYGTARLEAACNRAASVRSFSYRSVESILRNGLDKQPLLKKSPSLTHPRHNNVRGPDYYQ